MRVTVAQLCAGEDRERNIEAMIEIVRAACRADRPDVVVLPEMWSCLGGTPDAKHAAAEALGGAPCGPLHQAMARVAREEGIVLHGGSIGERCDGRLFNTTLVFDRDGAEIARYRKIHLFDVETPGGDVYRESAVFGAGDRIVTYRAGDLTVGCAICYDLRFPALFASLRDRGAAMIAVPAAFTLETGAAHWTTLIRARAIDTQCWIAAAATTGRHRDAAGASRSTFGHAMICDPWGTVVAEASPGVGWATARIDGDMTARVRRDMPVWSHRRPLS